MLFFVESRKPENQPEGKTPQSRVEQRGVLGFSVLQFLRSVFRFLCQKNFRFSVLVTIAVSVLFGSRFSAKLKSGFLICYSNAVWGFFFGSPLGKHAPLTTPTACTSSLILLAAFGFDRNSFRFCGFLLLFVRFCGFLRI